MLLIAQLFLISCKINLVCIISIIPWQSIHSQVFDKSVENTCTSPRPSLLQEGLGNLAHVPQTCVGSEVCLLKTEQSFIPLNITSTEVNKNIIILVIARLLVAMYSIDNSDVGELDTQYNILENIIV